MTRRIFHDYVVVCYLVICILLKPVCINLSLHYVQGIIVLSTNHKDTHTDLFISYIFQFHLHMVAVAKLIS